MITGSVPNYLLLGGVDAIVIRRLIILLEDRVIQHLVFYRTGKLTVYQVSSVNQNSLYLMFLVVAVIFSWKYERPFEITETTAIFSAKEHEQN